MSFSSAIIVSSQVDAARKELLQQEALWRWPFLRKPVLESHPEHLILALPETTDTAAANLELAFARNNLVYSTLPAWSQAFPEIAFALLEAECFGGVCIYGGYLCQAGQLRLEVISDRRGHVALLEALGLLITDFFAPLVRGYFATEESSSQGEQNLGKPLGVWD